MLVPVILSGGSGSRLWPLSREYYPKQFQTLVSEKTMLQETVKRLDGLDAESPILVCNKEHRFIAAEQLRRVRAEGVTILLEPSSRNTAPAIALAALHAQRTRTDPLLLILAADHVIREQAAFLQAVENASILAEQNRLVTFGIAPTRPETGYGYIKKGAPLGPNGFEVAGFEEKPDREKAKGFLARGDYFWNSGMFVFRASAYLEELKNHEPAMLEACTQAIGSAQSDKDFLWINEEAFALCPSNSVDYAVMERTSSAAVVPLDAGWDDIGSWSALWEVKGKDDAGNVLQGDVLTIGSKNCLVRSESRLVALAGIEDLIVVETADAVLIADKKSDQRVKEIVEAIKAGGREEHLTHRRVYRPWGHYESIDFGVRDQVKRITVNPGARLSVQMHHHRAEHWVVVRGTAKIQKGDDITILSENQSTYIPLGEVHALENPGKIPLEIIEVQTGSYLGEDDIVRFDDRYGRS